MAINPSELIIRPDGSIYHLSLTPEDICENIITVGDPARVGRISRHFDEVYFRKESREIVSHRGRIGNTDILVISTGMGTDNVEIVMNELDALANIDLQSRSVKKTHRSLSIIRIGTSGGIHTEVEPGMLVASRSGLGLDSLMEFYPFQPTEAEARFASAIRKELNLSIQPYHVYGSEHLLNRFGTDLYQGHTLTCPGFYAPQGRKLRLAPKDPDLLSKLMEISVDGVELTNIEMETAALYAFGRMMGHEILSLNAIIAERRNGKFADDPHQVIDKLIAYVLDRIEK